MKTKFVVLAILLFSTGALAQPATTSKGPTVGTKRPAQTKPSAPAGCKLVGTVKGTKLWAGDCVANEMRGGATEIETSPPAESTPPAGTKQ
jgi:hypothetical protein